MSDTLIKYRPVKIIKFYELLRNCTINQHNDYTNICSDNKSECLGTERDGMILATLLFFHNTKGLENIWIFQS